MCGIAGSKSRESGYDLYLQNLTRGYYSSSVTTIYDKRGGISTFKKEGKLELEDIPLGADYYLFHSRGPTVETGKFDWDDNHPFTYGRFSVAHNGIIENAYDLFCGEPGVDSRVIPVLIEEFYRGRKKNSQDAIRYALGKLKGTFGLWILDHGSSEIRIVRHDITLFNYGTEFSSSNPGYMKEVPRDVILKFRINSNIMEEEGSFVYAGKPKYFIPGK